MPPCDVPYFLSFTLQYLLRKDSHPSLIINDFFVNNFFRSDMSKEDWGLVVKLKKVFGIP